MGFRCDRREALDGMEGMDKMNLGVIAMILMTILIWYCIFEYGFFTTVIWLVVGACVIGIFLKLKEETRV